MGDIVSGLQQNLIQPKGIIFRPGQGVFNLCYANRGGVGCCFYPANVKVEILTPVGKII